MVFQDNGHRYGMDKIASIRKASFPCAWFCGALWNWNGVWEGGGVMAHLSFCLLNALGSLVFNELWGWAVSFLSHSLTGLPAWPGLVAEKCFSYNLVIFPRNIHRAVCVRDWFSLLSINQIAMWACDLKVWIEETVVAISVNSDICQA